jgi:hypothetical protein
VGAELGARGVEERGVGHLLAAALAQVLRLDRIERVDVGRVNGADAGLFCAYQRLMPAR